VGQNFFGVSQDSIEDEESDRGNPMTINLPGGNRGAKLSDLVGKIKKMIKIYQHE